MNRYSLIRAFINLPTLQPLPMLFEDGLGESFGDNIDEKRDSESEDGREDSESENEREDPESEDGLGVAKFKDAREPVDKISRRAGDHAEKGRKDKTQVDKNRWSPKQDDESIRRRTAMAKAFSDLKLKYYFAFNVIIPAYKRKTDKHANRVGEETETDTILDLKYLRIKSDITQDNYDTCGLFSADAVEAIRISLEEKEGSSLLPHENPGKED